MSAETMTNNQVTMPRATARGRVATKREATKRAATKLATSQSSARRTSTQQKQTRNSRTPDTLAQGALSWVNAHRLFAGIVGTLLVFAVVLYAPLSAYYAAWRTNVTLASQLAEVAGDNEILSDEVTSLLSKEGIEDEARRRGYVSEDETAVDMQGIEDTSGASTDVTLTENTEEEAPWYQAVLDFIFCYNPETQGIS